jgi:hypothetical protein
MWGGTVVDDVLLLELQEGSIRGLALGRIMTPNTTAKTLLICPHLVSRQEASKVATPHSLSRVDKCLTIRPEGPQGWPYWLWCGWRHLFLGLGAFFGTDFFPSIGARVGLNSAS